jgi:hypothetical protein
MKTDKTRTVLPETTSAELASAPGQVPTEPARPHLPTPADGVLAIEVKGNLAAMPAKASPTEDWPLQFALVAGLTAGNTDCRRALASCPIAKDR